MRSIAFPKSLRIWFGSLGHMLLGDYFITQIECNADLTSYGRITDPIGLSKSTLGIVLYPHGER